MTALRAGVSSLFEHPALHGIAIGACAADEPWEASPAAPQGEKAHAHIEGKRTGWVCVRRLCDYNATTIRHEIAHLVRGNARHDEAWRRAVRELGGRVERAYRKR